MIFVGTMAMEGKRGNRNTVYIDSALMMKHIRYMIFMVTQETQIVDL